MKALLITLITAAVLGVIGGTLIRESWPQPQPQPTHTRGLQHGVQPGDGQRQTLLMPEPNRRMGGMRPSACTAEDGDVSRQGCVWTNRRTGMGYYVNTFA